MDDKQLQRSETPAIRSFRICLAHPHRPTTILGVIGRVAAEQGELRAGPLEACRGGAISAPNQRLRLIL